RFLSRFYCSGDRRALHSFPTRRSSDLGEATVEPRPAAPDRATGRHPPWREAAGRDLSAYRQGVGSLGVGVLARSRLEEPSHGCRDRKSTRLNSSHVAISYAVFCLKKKR